MKGCRGGLGGSGVWGLGSGVWGLGSGERGGGNSEFPVNRGPCTADCTPREGEEEGEGSQNMYSLNYATLH